MITHTIGQHDDQTIGQHDDNMSEEVGPSSGCME